MRETVDCAAIKRGLQVFVLPRPNRHCDVFVMLRKRFPGLQIQPDDQGFVTNTGRFVSREEAAKIAIAAGQLAECKFQPNYLFTEDLW